MRFLDYFRSTRKTSATVAKDRLQIIVARERLTRNGPDYLPMMKEELLLVVRKYIQVEDGAVKVQLDKEGDYEVLELNITLPDNVAAESARAFWLCHHAQKAFADPQCDGLYTADLCFADRSNCALECGCHEPAGSETFRYQGDRFGPRSHPIALRDSAYLDRDE